MARMKRFGVIAFFVLSAPLFADDPPKDPFLHAAAAEAGKFSASEKNLYRQTIQSAKESVAREALDVFYRDALDAYRRSRYDEALDLLNNIYSVDPNYEDVAQLRETITRIKYSRDVQSKRGVLEDYMRKGNTAYKEGRNVQAIGFWKQALTVNPDYKPAKKRIADVNRAMAKDQYVAGYRNYRANKLEEALDNWSNAIILDPTLKERGLLLMMTKAQITLNRGQATRLNAEAYQLYADKDLSGALSAYEKLLAIDPRNEDARRNAARIKIQLGSTAFQSAQKAMSRGQYGDAIRHYQDAIRSGYEVDRAQKGVQQAESRIREAKRPKPAPAPKQPTETASATPPAEPLPPPPPKQPADPEKANKHYRQGMAAIRAKDYHHALQELDLASKYDPENEHIYVARERARQEWQAQRGADAASGAASTPPGTESRP